MDGKELRFLDDPHICSMPKRQNPFDIKMNPLKKLLLRLIVVSKKHPEHWKYLECENDITFEQRRQIYSKTWFVMHPFSILAGLCDTAMLIVYLLDQYNVPFLSTEKTSFSELKYFTAPLMVLNVARQFVTGYMDKEFMVAVLDLKKIFWHYFSGFFFLDLVGAVPLNTTIIFLCKLSGYHLNEHIRYYLGTLRLTVVFTLRLLHQCLMLSLEYFNANATIKRILPLVLYTGVFLNWSARMLVFVPKCVHGPDLPNVNGSWLNIRVHEGKEKPLDEPEEKLLVLCFFRTSMLLLKLGFGSVYPRTGEDVFLSVLLVIAGRMMFFYLIEQVLSLNRWMWSPRVRYHVQMKLVKGFLRHRDVPLVTQKKSLFDRMLSVIIFCNDKRCKEEHTRPDVLRTPAGRHVLPGGHAAVPAVRESARGAAGPRAAHPDSRLAAAAHYAARARGAHGALPQARDLPAQRRGDAGGHLRRLHVPHFVGHAVRGAAQRLRSRPQDGRNVLWGDGDYHLNRSAHDQCDRYRGLHILHRDTLVMFRVGHFMVLTLARKINY